MIEELCEYLMRRGWTKQQVDEAADAYMDCGDVDGLIDLDMNRALINDVHAWEQDKDMETELGIS